MFLNQLHQRAEQRDKNDDPNRWFVEIYNLPLHFNKEDIVYFVWKTLDKCHGLKKQTNPVIYSSYLRSLSPILFKKIGVFEYSSEAKRRLLIVLTLMAFFMYISFDFRDKNHFI